MTKNREIGTGWAGKKMCCDTLTRLNVFFLSSFQLLTVSESVDASSCEFWLWRTLLKAAGAATVTFVGGPAVAVDGAAGSMSIGLGTSCCCCSGWLLDSWLSWGCWTRTAGVEGWGLRDDGEALIGDSWSISGLMSSLSSLPTATKNTQKIIH